MKLASDKLIRLLYRIMSYLPRPLPSGVTQFNAMAARVHALAGGICTIDDARFVISTTVMRFDPDVSTASDRKFVTILRNAAAKQVSASIFQDIKVKQAEAAALASAAPPLAEATAPTAAASDGEKTSVPS